MSEDMRPLLRRAVETLPKIVRFRALNALNGFEKAITLLPVDREMASFRAMTAQEESAAALFKALQYQKYPGANCLNPRNHDHKWAVWLVIEAARMAVGKTFKGQMTLHLRAEPAMVQVSTPLSQISSGHPAELNDHRMIIEDPLDMFHRIDGAPNLFRAELDEIAEFNGHKSIATFLAENAAARNSLLYASDSALPQSRATLETLEARRQAGETALICAIIILQTPKLQAYALQGLEALLILIEKADAVSMPYPEDDPQAVQLDLPTSTPPEQQ